MDQQQHRPRQQHQSIPQLRPQHHQQQPQQQMQQYNFPQNINNQPNGKRGRDIPQTTQEVCQWTFEVLSSGSCGNIAHDAINNVCAAMSAEDVDGEVALTLTEDDLHKFGLVTLGSRRRLLNRIQETFQPLPQAPNQQIMHQAQVPRTSFGGGHGPVNRAVLQSEVGMPKESDLEQSNNSPPQPLLGQAGANQLLTPQFTPHMEQMNKPFSPDFGMMKYAASSQVASNQPAIIQRAGSGSDGHFGGGFPVANPQNTKPWLVGPVVFDMGGGIPAGRGFPGTGPGGPAGTSGNAAANGAGAETSDATTSGSSKPTKHNLRKGMRERDASMGDGGTTAKSAWELEFANTANGGSNAEIVGVNQREHQLEASNQLFASMVNEGMLMRVHAELGFQNCPGTNEDISAQRSTILRSCMTGCGSDF